jgi:glycosyltransferase involved in cell wall biosynthesis
MVERLGLSGRVMQPDQFGYICGLYNDEYMRAVYAASDVLLNPAKSEGFGLPLVEAQMCGTPIAVTDFSTSRELLSAGWLIDGQKHWSMGADSWRLLCYVDSIVSVLEEAYANRDNEVLRKQARKGAIKYDSAKVADEYWKPALTDIERMACNKGGLQLVTF